MHLPTEYIFDGVELRQATPCQQQQKGGSSSSTSTQATTTNTTDKRQVVDGNSVGVSSDSSTVNVTTLDNGAVNAAIGLAQNTGAAAVDAYKSLLNATVILETNAAKTIQANADLSSSLAATGQAIASAPVDQNKMLLFAALALGGFMLVKKS